jgi:hypothetical protein
MRNGFWVLTLLLPPVLHAQIQFNHTEVDFTATVVESDVRRMLRFSRQVDSVEYRYMKYSWYAPSMMRVELAREVAVIRRLWDSVKDDIPIELTGVDVGHPRLFTDITAYHVRTFLSSPEWQKHVRRNGKAVNHDLTNQVMMGGEVYAPLDSLLEGFGYRIVGYSTEKHGFMSAQELKQLGFTGTEVVPMPLIVWIRVERKPK